ncbi:MAG: hypothetical protein HY809_02430 [Nitrospirae bacterium]|nr:hypothetical protein [Nitrospirota bacterium]
MKLTERKNLFIFSLLLLGVLHLGYLLSLPDDAIFFSGDGGLKYLLTKEFLHGNISPELVLHPAPEAAELWMNGLYPFDVPFVYTIDGRKMVGSPLYFPLASAPFLAAMGWRGLYILPAAGVFLVWIWLILCSRSVQFGITSVCAVLVSVIFASPLTLYGGMFWEHAPAVFLAAIPLLPLILKRDAIYTTRSALIFGSLAGTGVFFRPEVLVCVICAIIASFIFFEKERSRYIAFFSVGFFISVSLFFTANQLLYGNILGLHSAQIKESVFSLWFAMQTFNRTVTLLGLSYQYWPPCVFILVTLPFVLASPYPNKRELLACISVIIVSIPLIALLVPNTGGKQWGPRYLLVLLPWGGIAVGLIVQAITQYYGRFVKVAALLFLSLSLALGLRINTWIGTKVLANDYRHRVLPALQLIREQPQKFVILTHQWISLELAELADEKTFLLVRNIDDLRRAEAELYRHGIYSILFVGHNYEKSQWEIPSAEIGRSESYFVLTVTTEK